MIRTWLTALLLLAPQTGLVPVVDGNIDRQEWAGAQLVKMSGGGDIQLLSRGDYLFVAVTGARPGLASLCVAKGKTVRILHASAAVGDASFERWGDIWMKRKDFEWSLRGSPSDRAKAEWLAAVGWLANASPYSSPRREFMILAKEVDYIGVTFLATGEPMTVSYWPSSMGDDCRSIKIPMGYLPDTARFDPSSWFKFRTEMTDRR